VVAVELNKILCIAANENLAVNNIKNVLIIPCDSEVFAKRILKNKSYTREDTGEVYDFQIVLVDPPR
jgi:tRNA/tmRNA/rRNA uracil-C5-methylase (TrmA/RlmC/RlmD family)